MIQAPIVCVVWWVSMGVDESAMATLACEPTGLERTMLTLWNTFGLDGKLRTYDPAAQPDSCINEAGISAND